MRSVVRLSEHCAGCLGALFWRMAQQPRKHQLNVAPAWPIAPRPFAVFSGRVSTDFSEFLQFAPCTSLCDSLLTPISLYRSQRLEYLPQYFRLLLRNRNQAARRARGLPAALLPVLQRAHGNP